MEIRYVVHRCDIHGYDHNTTGKMFSPKRMPNRNVRKFDTASHELYGLITNSKCLFVTMYMDKDSYIKLVKITNSYGQDIYLLVDMNVTVNNTNNTLYDISIIKTIEPKVNQLLKSIDKIPHMGVAREDKDGINIYMGNKGSLDDNIRVTCALNYIQDSSKTYYPCAKLSSMLSDKFNGYAHYAYEAIISCQFIDNTQAIKYYHNCLNNMIRRLEYINDKYIHSYNKIRDDIDNESANAMNSEVEISLKKKYGQVISNNNSITAMIENIADISNCEKYLSSME